MRKKSARSGGPGGYMENVKVATGQLTSYGHLTQLRSKWTNELQPAMILGLFLNNVEYFM